MVTNVQAAILVDIIEKARRGSKVAMYAIRHIRSQDTPEARECLAYMREYILMHPPHTLAILEVSDGH